MKTNRRMPVRPQGFSLVEMLLVLTIIGVLVSISMTALGHLRDNASQSGARRNAQNLTSVYTAALASGHDFAQGKSTVAEVVEAIVQGHMIQNGPLEAVFIGVPGLGPNEQTAAAANLSLVDGSLRYTP